MMMVMMMVVTPRTPGTPGENQEALPIHLIHKCPANTEHAM